MNGRVVQFTKQGNREKQKSENQALVTSRII